MYNYIHSFMVTVKMFYGLEFSSDGSLTGWSVSFEVNIESVEAFVGKELLSTNFDVVSDVPEISRVSLSSAGVKQ